MRMPLHFCPVKGSDCSLIQLFRHLIGWLWLDNSIKLNCFQYFQKSKKIKNKRISDNWIIELFWLQLRKLNKNAKKMMMKRRRRISERLCWYKFDGIRLGEMIRICVYVLVVVTFYSITEIHLTFLLRVYFNITPSHSAPCDEWILPLLLLLLLLPLPLLFIHSFNEIVWWFFSHSTA